MQIWVFGCFEVQKQEKRKFPEAEVESIAEAQVETDWRP